MEKSMIIVGAGIAGIATGYYARLNGYRTAIHEMHSVPGGLCAAWKRKGYTFDISMHMLTCSKRGPFNRLWQELGVLENQEFYYHKNMFEIESKGEKIEFCADPVRLEKQMLKLAPEDAGMIRDFVRLVGGPSMIDASSLKPAELSNFMDGLKMIKAILPIMGMVAKYSKVTLEEFAARFQNPFLRTAVRYFLDSPGWRMIDYPAMALAGFMQASLTDAGSPYGGSQQVVEKIAERYKRLGGEIRYKTKVTGIIVENNRAAGIRLADESEQRADLIVWAADGHTAVFDLLGGKYIDNEIRNMYDNWIPEPPLLQVMLGVARDMSREPIRLIYELDEPIAIAGRDQGWMSFINRSYDPSFAPAGKSVVEAWFATDYEYWKKLAHNQVAYKEEKQRIADLVIRALDKRWPGFASQVEVVDVPTPHTYERYTGNWQASPDGWSITTKNMMNRKMKKSLPGLADFYMVGQWTAPFTGTVLAAASGRHLIQILRRRDKKKFVTERN